MRKTVLLLERKSVEKQKKKISGEIIRSIQLPFRMLVSVASASSVAVASAPASSVAATAAASSSSSAVASSAVAASSAAEASSASIGAVGSFFDYFVG